MMIGIGTPSNQRSAPLAIVASVVVSDNDATWSGFLGYAAFDRLSRSPQFMAQST
jgi:hypothetical protein